MPIVIEDSIPSNTGTAIEMKAGQTISIQAVSTVDFVAFNLHNLRERFDQARTKTNQGKIYISTGDFLISKLNTNMLQIIEDTYIDGTHDLQQGMCSRDRWEWAFRHGVAHKHYFKDPSVTIDDFPDHGCFENLISATQGYAIPPEDIPAPFNIFQTMDINLLDGSLLKTKRRPSPGTVITMRAMVDLLVAMSACPDTAVGGRDVHYQIFSG